MLHLLLIFLFIVGNKQVDVLIVDAAYQIGQYG